MPNVKNLGAANDRMFSTDTRAGETQIAFSILKKPFWIIWSCPENYLFVEMSKRNFGRLESFWLIFSSHPSLKANQLWVQLLCSRRRAVDSRRRFFFKT